MRLAFDQPLAYKNAMGLMATTANFDGVRQRQFKRWPVLRRCMGCGQWYLLGMTFACWLYRFSLSGCFPPQGIREHYAHDKLTGTGWKPTHVTSSKYIALYRRSYWEPRIRFSLEGRWQNKIKLMLLT